MIPYGKQNIIQADIDAVVDTLKSNFLTQGPQVPLFERELAEYCRAEFAVAMNSATSALHLACLALGLSKGDILWTTPITFVASANCGLYCGAKVDFVDIDPQTYNLSIESLEAKLRKSRVAGTLPKVLVAVHLCGQPCEMAKISKLSKEYGFSVIEDASHSIGGRYRDEPIGNCRYSDITVFSFHPVKIVTTAEGGLATTNDLELASRMELLRSHGITRDPSLMVSESDGPWYYQQIDLGFNYRMTDLQAALGISQMKRLDEFVSVRHQLMQSYNEQLISLPVIVPWQHPDSYSGGHLYVIRLQLDKIALTHRQVFEGLRQKQIGVNLHYIPVYRQPYYQEMGFSVRNEWPQAELYYQAAISLPMYPLLGSENQKRVVAALEDLIGAVSK